jgi:hypothetical protein
LRIGPGKRDAGKIDPRFTQTIEPIRAMGFKPDHLHHMRAFDLPRSDSVAGGGDAAHPS